MRLPSAALVSSGLLVAGTGVDSGWEGRTAAVTGRWGIVGVGVASEVVRGPGDDWTLDGLSGEISY